VLHVAHVERARGDPLVKSIPQAVCVLGLSSLGMIAMRGAAMLAFEHVRSRAGFDVDDFWRHSLLAAHVSREMAGRMPARVSGLSADQLYAGVLLHDIGQLVLLENLGPAYADVRCSIDPQQDMIAIEDKLIGRNHAVVGAHLVAQWNLPEAVSGRIALHHAAGCTDESAELARIISSSDRIAHAIAGKQCASPAELVRRITDPPQAINAAVLTEIVASATKWYAQVDQHLLRQPTTA
jgi:putative nucleotidyltransferase with HDIG domain